MRIICAVSLLLFSNLLCAQQKHEERIRAIYDFFLTKSDCYKNLEHLSTKIGGRLSGSAQAEKAVEWARKAMWEAGADTVFLQPCTVQRWVRGEREQCSVISGNKTTHLRCTALGGSVGTKGGPLTADVIEVHSFQELTSLGENKIKGKVVFYNVFFDQRFISTFDAYRDAVKYRAMGASNAAKFGAVACLVRSMTSSTDDEPHTGYMYYDTTISTGKIPSLALGYKSADLLHNMIEKTNTVRVSITLTCKNLQPVTSYNVVGQINGSEDRGQYIITGGHLDSWDNGQGAHDDGAGIVHSIGALQAFHNLGIKPRHTIRAVAFMNEENGLAGGKAYAKWAAGNNESHVAAIESDAGGFLPLGFSADTTNGIYDKIVAWKHLFAPYYVYHFEKNSGGADLRDLQKTGVPCIGFLPDMQRYFDIHHSAADTFDKVNKRELELGAAAITSLMYLLDEELK
jgi:carboxypeptidase Q